MATELSRHYPASLATAARARDDLAAFLREQGQEALVAEAMLLVSELVTNSVLHACGRITMCAHLEGRVLRVEVADSDPTLPAPRQPDVTGGRGLHIVAALASDWGSAPSNGSGKTTWFTIDTHAADEA